MITVAKIIEEKPVIDYNNGNISSYSSHITIKGTGFDGLTPSNNHFVFMEIRDGESQVEATPVSSTWTTLTLSFKALSPTNWGPLSTQLQTRHNTTSDLSCFGITNSSSEWSNEHLIADTYIETPAIEARTTTLQTNSLYVTIHGALYLISPSVSLSLYIFLRHTHTHAHVGTGFDYVNPTVNKVTFVSSGAPNVQGTVESTTRTTLKVKLSAIASSNEGVLEAFVTIEDENLIYRRRLNTMVAPTSNGTVSQTRQIATVVQSAPHLYSDEVTLMKSTGDKVTLRGVGFSLSENDNVVILYPASGLPTYAPTGRVVNSTFTTLVYSFEALHPENAGALSASVVSNTFTSNQVVIVTVIPCPVIDSSASVINSNANEITISGRGFYVANPSMNYVRFPMSGTSIAEAAGYVREVGLKYVVAFKNYILRVVKRKLSSFFSFPFTHSKLILTLKHQLRRRVVHRAVAT